MVEQRTSVKRRTSLTPAAGHPGRVLLLLAGFVLPGFVPAAQADPGEDPLWRYVADDAMVCLHVRDAKSTWQSWSAHPWAARMLQSELVADLRTSKQFRYLSNVAAVIEDRADRPLPDLLSGLFGESALLVTYPRHGNPAAVLLTRAESVAVLESGIELWNNLGDGEIRINAVPHRDGNYFRRRRFVDGDVVETTYYAVNGRILATSEDPRLVSKTMELVDKNTATDGRTTAAGIASLPFFRRAAKGVSDEAAAWIFVNSRNWSATLPPPSEDDVVETRAFAEIQKISAVTIAMQIGEELTTRVQLLWDDPDVAPWGDRSTLPISWTNRVPADYWVAAGASFDLRPVAQAIEQLAAAAGDEKFDNGRRLIQGVLLGLDPLTDIAAALGPEAMVVVSPAADPAARFPLEAWAAIRYRDDEGEDDSTDIGLAVDNAVGMIFNLAVAGHNEKHPYDPWRIGLRSVGKAKSLVRTLSGMPAVTPTFTVTDDTIVLATSPEALTAALPADTKDVSRLSEFRDRRFPEAQAFAVVRTRPIAEFLSAPPNTAWIAPQADETRLRHLTRIREMLSFFDTALFTLTLSDRDAAVEITLATDDSAATP